MSRSPSFENTSRGKWAGSNGSTSWHLWSSTYLLKGRIVYVAAFSVTSFFHFLCYFLCPTGVLFCYFMRACCGGEISEEGAKRPVTTYTVACGWPVVGLEKIFRLPERWMLSIEYCTEYWCVYLIWMNDPARVTAVVVMLFHKTRPVITRACTIHHFRESSTHDSFHQKKKRIAIHWVDSFLELIIIRISHHTCHR